MRTWFMLLLVGWGLLACAHRALWSPRTLPRCPSSTGVVELDRERSYLASLLALDARRYALLRSLPGRELEATYVSDYPAGQPATRWVISVLDDASVVLDVPSNAKGITKRELQWADRLVFSIQQNQCRELDWLRWEAQNRGLVAVGAGAGAAVPPSAGGELATAPSPPSDPSTAAQLAALRQERGKIRIAPSAATAAVGVGFAAAGASILSQGLVYALRGCDQRDSADGPDCTSRDAGRVLWPIGVGVLGSGLVTLSVALPFLLRNLRHARELNRRMKALRTLRVGPTSQRGGVGLTWGGSF